LTAIYELLTSKMRERFGGSVTRLSEACDVSVALGSRWVHEDERKRIVPGPASCEKIAIGLDLDPDYVLELAGHRKARPAAATVDPVRSELDARLAKLGATLSKYPRAVWLAVLEANERMADALHHAEAEPPVSAPSEGGVSASGQPLTQGPHDPEPPLSLRKRALAQVGAW
jgi:hypothetical protein